MQHQVKIYNSLTRKKEVFEPINPPFVGLYLCGPTVYGDAHLGHARSAVVFDVVFRYLKKLGYKVRYVRNITDVGHLERDADTGEDKIAKQARVEQLEPMEVAQYHTNTYHEDMKALNTLAPSIEPVASGHIIEQIELIQKIITAGFAYEVNGSVYFDVAKYNQNHHYGILSGRIIEDLISSTRDLDGQDEKRNPPDFALWKKAEPMHIMRWSSPWSEGFPGWHIECSAMSGKYLGRPFDIHGGGMDLLFPHHECEIAQTKAGEGVDPVKYWMHNNMITVNGQKMGKSLNNSISLRQFFVGNHPGLERAYSPMAIRFFILQAHYRSTLDFSNDALQAGYKAYLKILNGLKIAENMAYPNNLEAKEMNKGIEKELEDLMSGAYKAMNDDFNTAIAIASLFGVLKKIQQWSVNPQALAEIPETLFAKTLSFYSTFVQHILGLVEEKPENQEALLDIILVGYAEAKAAKDYAKVDVIRAQLKATGITVKDMKTGIGWAYDDN